MRGKNAKKSRLNETSSQDYRPTARVCLQNVYLKLDFLKNLLKKENITIKVLPLPTCAGGVKLLAGTVGAGLGCDLGAGEGSAPRGGKAGGGW